MNLSKIFDPTTKLRHVDSGSKLLGNKSLKFIDGCWLPPFNNAVGDKKIGPATPSDYSSANIEANDKGLALQVYSGSVNEDNEMSKYERHDFAIGRIGVVLYGPGFRYETPIDGTGCAITAGTFVPGAPLVLKDWIADDPDNWKLTDTVPSGDRYVYAKVVTVNSATVEIETVQPYVLTTP